MTIHHARTLHGSAPNKSDRPRLILFYEIARADAWPILGASSYFHGLGQYGFWEDLQDRMIIGQPCLEPCVENVPVKMPLPPAPNASSIFSDSKIRRSKRFSDQKLATSRILTALKAPPLNRPHLHFLRSYILLITDENFP